MPTNVPPGNMDGGPILGRWYCAVDEIVVWTRDGLNNKSNWTFPAGTAIRPTRDARFWAESLPLVEIDFAGPIHEWDSRSRVSQFLYVADLLAHCVPCNTPAADGTVPDPPPLRPPPSPPQEVVIPGHPSHCWRLPNGNFLVEELVAHWPTTGTDQVIGPDALPVPGELLYWEFSPDGKRLRFFGRPSHGTDEDFCNYVFNVRLVWDGKLCRYSWAERYGPGKPWKDLSLKAVEQEGLMECPPDEWPQTFTR